jgi:putative transposase
VSVFDSLLALSYNEDMLKTFKYRLFPTKHQQTLLNQYLEECRWLYNHLLTERRDAWNQRKETLRYYDQAATLPALKARRFSLASVNSQVLQNVAVRVDLAFKAFFGRCKSGDEPGYPRYRGKGRYNSITFPQVPNGCKILGGLQCLKVMSVGQIKLVYHRPIEGTPKTATISCSHTGKWYVSVTCECDVPNPLEHT